MPGNRIIIGGLRAITPVVHRDDPVVFAASLTRLLRSLLLHAHTRSMSVSLGSVMTGHVLGFASCSLHRRGGTTPGDPAERRDAVQTNRLQHHPHVQAEGGAARAHQQYGMARHEQPNDRAPQVS